MKKKIIAAIGRNKIKLHREKSFYFSNFKFVCVINLHQISLPLGLHICKFWVYISILCFNFGIEFD